MSWLNTYRSDFRTNLRLALPLMAGQVGQITVNVADNIMVGQLGSTALAAVSLGIAIFVSFMVVGMGLSFALPPLVAEAEGQNNPKRISRLFKHSLLINIVFALVSIVIIQLAMPVLHHIGQDPAVVKEVIPYLHINVYSLLPLMVFNTFRGHSDGLAQTLWPMIAMLTANVFNILFNYMFIYGKFGAPELGVKGAALGTLLARIIMVVIIVVLLINRKRLWSYIAACDFTKYQPIMFKNILKLGIPTSLQMFFEVTVFAAASILCGMISKEAQAAHQIAINLASITFLIATGLAITATIRVGNQLGKKDYPALQSAGISALIQVTAFMAVGAILFIVFRHQLPAIYKADDIAFPIASGLLLLAAIFQISDGIQVVSIGALRGMQDVFIPTIITFIAYWLIGFPISYFLSKSLGPNGVWIGLVAGLTVSAILNGWRFWKLSSAKMKIN